MKKFTTEEVSNYISENGYSLISEYKNCKEYIEIECSCHKMWKVRLKSLLYHKNFPCSICSSRKIKLGTYNYDDMKQFVEIDSNSGCKILSLEYFGIYYNYDFQCRCGNIFTTTFCYFKHENQRRCPECKKADRKLKRLNNSSRDELKSDGQYQTWRDSVLKRDNYTCRCCGNKKNLCAHHLSNFSNDVENRLNIENGITLCDGCHNFNKYGSFHYVYGSRDNNKEQLYEYIEKNKRGAFAVMKLANLM